MNITVKIFFCCLLITSVAYGRTFIVPSVSGIAHLQKRMDPRQRKSSYPYVTGDTFRSICDFIIDEERIPFNPELVKDGDIIFLNADYMDFFFSQIHDRIKVHYILLTHNSDVRIPGGYAKYLDDEKLIAWFGQNVGYVHSKLIPIPIGVANTYTPVGDTNIIKKVAELPKSEKKFLLYVNINIHTNLQERAAIRKSFEGKSFCYVSNNKPFVDYLNDLKNSKFVLSPPGNGFDCHRTWEALYMGAIPIVKSSAMNVLFENLPVLIVNDWSKINEEFLIQQYERIKLLTFDKNKLLFDYWIDQIRSVQNMVSEGVI